MSFRLSCNMTAHNLPHRLAQSRQQLQGIDFTLFFFCLCLVDVSSRSVLFFPPRPSQGGPLTIHWFNWQKIDPISSKPVFSELISRLPEEMEEYRFVCFRHTQYKKVLYPSVFWMFISASAKPKKNQLGWMIIFFFVKWSHEAVIGTDSGSVLPHLSAEDDWYDSKVPPKRPYHNICSVRREMSWAEFYLWPDNSKFLFSLTKQSLAHFSHIHWRCS